MEENYKNKIKKLLIGIKNNPNDKDIFLCKLNKFNKNKLIMSIMEIIDEELLNFSYTDNHDITYLLTSFDILDETLLLDNQKNNITKYINKIHTELLKLLSLKSNTELNSKIVNKKYKSLLLLLNELDNNMTNYKHISASNELNEEAIVFYTVFNLKSYSTLDNLLNRSPKLINTIDKNGNTLIKKVILNYLISLKNYINLGDRVNLIYYDRVFRRLINDKNLRLSESEKQDLIKYTDSFINKINIDNNRKLEEVTYYKNKIELSLLGSFEEDTSIKNLNYEYGIRKDFNPAINSEAKRIYVIHHNLPEAYNDRKIYTFDHNPNEIDDGLSVVETNETYIAGVHIANPLGYMNFNSIIFNEARKRSETLYVDDVIIPMLPDILSKDLMGLNANNNIHSMGFYYTFDKTTGALLKQEIKDEIIKVDKNLEYTDYDYIIRNSTDEELIKDLIRIETVSKFIAREYDNTILNALIGTNSSRGINVVTNMMIGNNIYTAKLFNDNELPFAYRNHKLNENKEEIDNIRKKVLNRDPITNIFRLLEELDNISHNATYSPRCLGHDSLNVKYYSHTTSPLRRYIDILNLECINKFILGTYTKEDIKKYTELIYVITEEINSKRQFINSYTKELERRLTLKS